MSHVYLICQVIDGHPYGPCKIGVTKNLFARLAALQTGSPNKLEYYEIWHDGRNADGFECFVHEMLADQRLHGEWFNIEPEVARQKIELYIRTLLLVIGDTNNEIGDINWFGKLQPIRERELLAKGEW